MNYLNKTAKMCSSDIAVVVIYDGIDKMNDKTDEKETMMGYFRDLDQKFHISALQEFQRNKEKFEPSK